MIITHYLQADLTAAQQQFPPIRVMQGDNDSRAIAISLFDGAAAYEIPQDAEAVVRFRRADGSGGVYDTLPNGDTAWSLEENTVTVMLAPQVMAAWGSVAVSVALVYRQQILGIVPFSVTVLPDPAVGQDRGLSRRRQNVCVSFFGRVLERRLLLCRDEGGFFRCEGF